jgi:hypothetical protein
VLKGMWPDASQHGKVWKQELHCTLGGTLGILVASASREGRRALRTAACWLWLSAWHTMFPQTQAPATFHLVHNTELPEKTVAESQDKQNG